MAVQGAPRKFDKKFKFVVEIDGFAVAKFTKAGPLEIEVAVVEQHEGGALVPEKEPGRVKVADVVLERGATDDEDMWNWFQLVANIAANSGVVTPNYKKNVDIVQQDRDGTTLKRWRLFDAWPSKFKGGDWDNDADENVIESMTLTYKYPDRVKTPA